MDRFVTRKKTQTSEDDDNSSKSSKWLKNKSTKQSVEQSTGASLPSTSTQSAAEYDAEEAVTYWLQNTKQGRRPNCNDKPKEPAFKKAKYDDLTQEDYPEEAGNQSEPPNQGVLETENDFSDSDFSNPGYDSDSEFEKSEREVEMSITMMGQEDFWSTIQFIECRLYNKRQ